MAKEAVELNGSSLRQGDGAGISNEQKLSVKGLESAEILLFDLRNQDYEHLADAPFCDCVPISHEVSDGK